jgi:hypothetical protein
MAITINASPVQYSPVRNDIVYSLSSSNTAQTNFQYVLDLYISGVSTPAFFRKTRSADPVTGYAWFDVHAELKSYLSYDLDITTYGWQSCPNSIVGYRAYFGEMYGPSSGVTVYSGLTVGTQAYAWAGGLDFLDFKDYTATKYPFNSVSSVFLTDAPTTLTVRSDENRWLYGINSASGKADKMRIKTYSSPNASGLIQTIDVVNTYSGVTTDASRMVRFGMGGNNLNSISASLISSGAQPIITASVQSYTCQAIKADGTVVSELRTFNIVDEQSKFDLYTFHFLNEEGGFDTWSFILANKQEVSIKRDRMKKIIGSWSGSTWGYNKYDRQTTIYNTELTDKITVNSTFVTTDVAQWLEQLIASPNVFLDHATHGLVAVNIVQDSVELKTNKTTKLISISFTFEYSFNRTR